MKDYRMKKNLRRLAAALSVAIFTGTAWMPTGRAAGGLPDAPSTGNFTTGVSFNTGTVGTLNITATNLNNVIKWDAFSIGGGKTVSFDDHNYLNYVTGDAKSQIDGIISGGTGKVYLLNPNGIVFGETASVTGFNGGGGLLVSTRSLDNIDTLLTSWDGNSPLSGDATLTKDIVNNMSTSLTGMNITLEGDTVKFTHAANNASGIGGGADYTVNADKIYIDAQYPGTTFTNNVNAGGSTSNQYWLVDTADELKAIGTDTTSLRYNYILTGNISGVTKPIEGIFTGTLDGKDLNGTSHSIGLNINESNTDNVGLFEEIGGGTAKNLTLTGSVTGQDNVGALVGKVNEEATITSVYSSASVTGNNNIGGLVGMVKASNTTRVYITDFKGTGAVTATGTGGVFGGIIGSVDTNGSSSYIVEVDGTKTSTKPWIGAPALQTTIKQYKDNDTSSGSYIEIKNVSTPSGGGGGGSSTPSAPSVPSTPIVTPEPISVPEATPETVPETVVEAAPEPAATPAATTLALVTESYRSIQDATNAASASASKSDTMESNELLKDKHAGMFMNSTHNVRHVALDEASLARMLQGDGKDTGIEFSTEVTGETESTTTELSGFFEGDDVGTVEA